MLGIKTEVRITMCVLLTACVVIGKIHVDDYYAWTPQNSTRADLYCPLECQTVSDPNKCCSCQATQCWEIIPLPAGCDITVAFLHVEYMNIAGETKIIVELNEIDSTYFKLVHTDGIMSSIPLNICDFPNLLNIELVSNNIREVGNISCLTHLNVLDLSYNKLTYLSNTTFTAFNYLRILRMAGNTIEALDPNTIKPAMGNIFTVDMASNPLYKFDVSNIFLPGSFCVRNYSRSKIADIVNVSGFKANKYEIIGPGDIDMSNSVIKQLVNLTDYGMDYLELISYLEARIRYLNSSLSCDCSLVPFLKDVGYPGVLRFWPDIYNNFTCQEPEHLKGTILDAYDNATLDKFICDLPRDCPYQCRCIDQQSQKKVIVNCTNVIMTSLPADLPFGYFNNRELEIILDGCNITRFENRNYMNRIGSIHLSGCPIEYLDSNAIQQLPDNVKLDLSGMIVTHIPRILQKKDPHFINFGSRPIICDCTNTWIGDWLRAYDVTEKLNCTVNGMVMQAEHVTESMIDCIVTQTNSGTFVVLGICLTILIISVICIYSAAYYFKYELLVWKRRKFTNKSKINIRLKYDAFISFDEDDDTPTVVYDSVKVYIGRWIREQVNPRFEEKSYKTFVPFIDMPAGGNLEQEVTEAISQSKTYIVFYTKHYLKSEQSRFQFKTIWSNYERDSNKDIILINFDYSATGEISSRELRAIVRMGNTLDFAIRDDTLLDRLFKCMPPPAVHDIQHASAWTMEDLESLNEREVSPIIARGKQNRVHKNHKSSKSETFSNSRFPNTSLANDSEPGRITKRRVNKFL